MNKKCPDYSGTQRISLPLFFIRIGTLSHSFLYFSAYHMENPQ